MLKVDMAKTYDRVDWNFLNQVMKNFSCSSRVLKAHFLMCLNPVVFYYDERHIQRLFQI